MTDCSTLGTGDDFMDWDLEEDGAAGRSTDITLTHVEDIFHQGEGSYLEAFSTKH